MRDYTRFASKLSDLFRSDRKIQSASDDDGGDDIDARSTASRRYSLEQFTMGESALSSPYNNMSPWNRAASPFVNSPWIHPSSAAVSPLPDGHDRPAAGLIGSLIREEGHVYSLATAGDLLYTGSDSKNIRVWKRWREFGGFKSGSGLVKAIVVAAGGKIFTGHQDGKIRVWRISPKDPSVHKRVGTLPKFKDLVRTSVNPSNYVEVRRRKRAVWIRHFDAVSCLSLDVEAGLLYSGSWDRTVKVWRVSDSRCLESIRAHDDAVNAVAVAPGGLVFTGSADGTVKLWRRGEGFRHAAAETMLRQESAVTALAVAGEFVYSGSSDGAVNVWERCRRGMEKCGTVLRGHRMAVLCLAAAGNLVASGSADGTVRVWRREAEGRAHALVSVLAGHTGPVKCLAIEADKGWCGGGGAEEGRWVVYSGSLDQSVKVWRVSDSALDGVSPPQEAAGSHMTNQWCDTKDSYSGSGK